MRLQALVRSRLLTHRFTLLRSKMVTLQRHCRAYLSRTWYERRHQSVLVLQAGIRKMIAQTMFRRRMIEVENLFFTANENVLHGRKLVSIHNYNIATKLKCFHKYLQSSKLAELEELRKQDEMNFRKTMNAQKAKAEAERLHKVNIHFKDSMTKKNSKSFLETL